MLKTPVTLLLLLLGITGLAHADAYKCRTADGRTEITSTPCAAGSSTIKSQPAEKVSEIERQRVEKEVERMREYVELRENAQRFEAPNDAAAQTSRQQAPARAPVAGSQQPAASPLYGNADECLRNVAQMTLEATQRTQMENDCRQLQPPPPITATPVASTTFVPYPVPVRSNGQVISNIPTQQQNHATVVSSTPGAARAPQEPPASSQVLMPRLKKQQQP